MQTAAKLILEPIFEADFLECSYGYRPGAARRMRCARWSLVEGNTAVYDADLQGYFRHDPARPADARWSSGGWRTVGPAPDPPVADGAGGRARRDGRPATAPPKQGTPQGGVISPLLANLYLHWFDMLFHRRGAGQWANARLVRYADDS